MDLYSEELVLNIVNADIDTNKEACESDKNTEKQEVGQKSRHDERQGFGEKSNINLESGFINNVSSSVIETSFENQVKEETKLEENSENKDASQTIQETLEENLDQTNDDSVGKKRKGRRTRQELKELKPTRFGQCGNQLGEELFSCAFNDMLCEPYWNNTCARDSWFHHTTSGQLKARSILVDSESKVVSSVNRILRKGTLWTYNEQNMIYNKSGGASNNFALGYSDRGPMLKNDFLDAFRRECEKCDRVKGVISLSSCAGGTGSGAGTFLLEKVRDVTPQKNLISVLVTPYISGETVTQNYNTLFTLTKQNAFCDALIIFENDLISKLVLRHLQLPTASFPDLNNLISQNLLSFLQPVSRHADMYHLLSQLCPHPSYKFLTIKSFPVLIKPHSQFQGSPSWKSIERDLIRSVKTSLYCSNIDFINGVANVIISRGQQVPDSTIIKLRSFLFSAPWVPANCRFYDYHHTRRFFQQEKYLTLLSNNSSICGLLDSCIDKAWKLFSKNMYIHHYYQYGFTKDDFMTAFLKSKELLKSYKEL